MIRLDDANRRLVTFKKRVSIAIMYVKYCVCVFFKVMIIKSDKKYSLRVSAVRYRNRVKLVGNYLKRKIG